MNMDIVSHALHALLKDDDQAAFACRRLRQEVLSSPYIPGNEKSLILLMLSVAHGTAPSKRYDLLAWLALRLWSVSAIWPGRCAPGVGENQGCRVTDSTSTLLNGILASSTWTLAMASTTSMPAMTWPNTA